MYISVKKKWQPILNIAMIIIGCFIMGFAFSVFFEPNKITTGGFSGIAMMLSSLFQKAGVKFLSSSIIYLILNLILFLIALKSMGKVFAINAIVGIGAFSGAMEVFSLIPEFGDFDLIISALFGGVMIGFGLGLVVRFGGSTGGSDMIACMVRKKYPRVHIGRIVVCIDICVVAMTLIVYKNGLQLLPYTIIALAISSFVVDFVNEGYKQIRAYTIITTKPNEIAEKIKTTLVRGCTMTRVKGMYENDEKGCIVCLITKYQIGTMKRIITETDPKAFVYAIPVTEVIGEWRQEPHEEINEELEREMKIGKKRNKKSEKGGKLQKNVENVQFSENLGEVEQEQMPISLNEVNEEPSQDEIIEKDENAEE